MEFEHCSSERVVSGCRLQAALFHAFRGVLCDHLHQSALFAALGGIDADFAAALVCQPVRDGVCVFQICLYEDSRRYVRIDFVELLDEGAEYLAWGVVLCACHDEVVSSDEFSLADEEDFHPGLVVGDGECDEVEGFGGDVEDFLPFVHFFDGLDLVAQAGGLLEFEVFGSMEHLCFEGFEYAIRFAIEEQEDSFDDLAVLVFIYCADAGADAAVDVEVEAWSGVVARYGLGA